MEIVILIPSYEPTQEFIAFVAELRQTFKQIVVVNDGSGKTFNEIFDAIEQMQVPVLRHEVNKGKGRALKTGIQYIAETYQYAGIVTADSDGQHTVKDIGNVAHALQKHNDQLILGSRDFDQKDVPWKSMFGNKMTRVVLSFFCGVRVSDTQTGLRGMSIENALQFLNVKGERFEFETNMLIETKSLQIPILEEKIATVYVKENEGTHFNPIRDSLQIYKMFAKYMATALVSFLLDIILFSIFLNGLDAFVPATYTILAATICARIISSIVNYFLNCKAVFHSGSSFMTMLKYYLLVVVVMFASGFFVQGAVAILPAFIHVILIKLIVDTILFAANFYIQREWIFKEKESTL